MLHREQALSSCTVVIALLCGQPRITPRTSRNAVSYELQRLLVSMTLAAHLDAHATCRFSVTALLEAFPRKSVFHSTKRRMEDAHAFFLELLTLVDGEGVIQLSVGDAALAYLPNQPTNQPTNQRNQT